MIDMIGNQVYDYNTCTWIAQKLEIDRPWRLHNRLITLTENDFAERRGRPPLDITLSSAIYLEWISSSVVSTDSHNSRGEVHISQAGYNNSSVHQCGIKLFEEIKPYTNKRNILMYRCPRMLTTMTVSMMQANIEKKLGKSVSRGSIYALKPFFCVEPTDREKSLCLCKICLNTRQIFDAVGGCCKKNTAANFPVSISEYFMANCKCEDKDTNGYYNLKCIKGNCSTEGDNSTPTLHLSVQDMVGTVSYYQYELLTSTYTVKRGVDAGKEKETMRTERVSYSVAIQDAIFKLDSLKTKYLLHRYLIADDKMHWPSVMATVCEEKPIFL